MSANSMSAQHTPGPRPVQIQGRPRRWGIPTAAQFKLLADCVEGGGCAFQRGHSLGTLIACQKRLWVVIHARRYGNDDNRADITEQGRAVVRSNSQ